jgi:hypothetical protein
VFTRQYDQYVVLLLQKGVDGNGAFPIRPKRELFWSEARGINRNRETKCSVLHSQYASQ